MDKDLAVIAECASKKYCRSLKRSMLYGVADITRNVLGLSSRPGVLRPDEFWALDDISFELKKGHTLGVIGPNGSGKTTLLKMLNGIFWPDKGKVGIKGKVGALIEVGAGFHQALTGRENIYINGAILGMTKKEIDAKFDSIVEFADIGHFLDSPVKHYSSGMYVRLGFAVAVHCEPDILLVDEVLAVGDSAFRIKCHRKMDEIRKKGVAIVMVSHNLLAIERYCDEGLLLDKGLVRSRGEIHKVIRDYQKVIEELLGRQRDASAVIAELPYCTKEAEITDVQYLDEAGLEKKEFASGSVLGIAVRYKAAKPVRNPIFQVFLFNSEGARISVSATHIEKIVIDEIAGEGVVECRFKDIPLLLGRYYAVIGIYDRTHNVTLDYWVGSFCGCYFQVSPNYVSEKMAEYTPLCNFAAEWSMNGEKLSGGRK